MSGQVRVQVSAQVQVLVQVWVQVLVQVSVLEQAMVLKWMSWLEQNFCLSVWLLEAPSTSSQGRER